MPGVLRLTRLSMTTQTTPALRPIQSFVRREGRITPSQQRALDGLWDDYVLDYAQRFDPTTIFGRSASTIVEIGFGDGAALLDIAAKRPEVNFVGVEVYRAGIGRLMAGLAREQITNVRLVSEDAVQWLKQQAPQRSLSAIHLFFPDPWPKKKHHKRRIVNPAFLALVHSRLLDGGCFHFATDWQPYAEWSLELLEATPAYVNAAGAGQFSSRPDYRPITKFERRGQRLGHGSWDLIYTSAVNDE